MDLSLEAVIGLLLEMITHVPHWLFLHCIFLAGCLSMILLGEGWMGMSVLISTFKLALTNFCARFYDVCMIL